MGIKYYVPINLDIEVEADNADKAWEEIYTKINGQIIDLVESNFAGVSFVLEVGEPDEVRD
jgi:hypothetical protein